MAETEKGPNGERPPRRRRRGGLVGFLTKPLRCLIREEVERGIALHYRDVALKENERARTALAAVLSSSSPVGRGGRY